MKKLILLGVACALAACKQPLDIGSFSVTGAWRGVAYVPVGTDSVAYTFRLDLKQDQATVTGDGAIGAAADSVRTSVRGTWAYPNVTLRLTAPGYAEIQFAGAFARQVSRDSLVGPLAGSGFTGRQLTLVRQAP